MPETARILQFPNRWGLEAPLSVEAATETARAYLASTDRSEANLERHMGNPDVGSAVCARLRESLNTIPAVIAREAALAYQWLLANPANYLFDEHDYFLGETALLATGAARLLGRRDEAERWLERAAAAFSHTLNPAPLLARVAYERLAIRYERAANHDVLDLLPSTLRTFERLGMRAEADKARFLEAMALKDLSRDREALEKFQSLERTLRASGDQALLGQVLVELGGYYSAQGNHEDAIKAFRRALSLLAAANRVFAVAHLRMTLGESLRGQGKLEEAVGAFREGVETYAKLGMASSLAYSRLILAEALLAGGQVRQAEWEITAALPTIEEQKMVPEGFAAVALLRESVRQRKADPKALRELREHLQAQN